MAKRLLFTVTNDLNYDQRMIRICTSLAHAGYEVTLIGVQRKSSLPLTVQPYTQKRLPILAERGKLFYAGYNIFLLFYLLFKKADALCAIDLDTILPVYFASVLKGHKRVYDAHEIFTEMPELGSKPREAKFWQRISDFAIPKFPQGYTVGNYLAQHFKKQYGHDYLVITNAALLRDFETDKQEKGNYILYQGAVNKGRLFDELIEAMQWVEAPLLICGKGSYFEETQALVKRFELEEKVIFKGFVAPDDLLPITRQAKLGLILLDDKGRNNYYSLANRVFDYMHAGIPQISMDFPEYKAINERFEIALLLPANPSPHQIAAAINKLLKDRPYYDRLKENALKARQYYNWQHNEKSLVAFYDKILAS